MSKNHKHKSIEEVEKPAEVFQLSDGTAINKYCMDQFDTIIANMETFWDVWDVTTKLTRLEVTRDENGLISDVELIVPRINEVVAMWALRSFLKVHEERGESMSPETAMELRRIRLEKYLKEEGG